MDNDTYLLKPRVSRNVTPSQLSIPVGSVRKLHETASIDHSYPELQLPTICWQPVFLVGICTSIAFGDFSAIFLVRLLPPPTRCTFGSPSPIFFETEIDTKFLGFVDDGFQFAAAYQPQRTVIFPLVHKTNIVLLEQGDYRRPPEEHLPVRGSLAAYLLLIPFPGRRYRGQGLVRVG